MLNKTLLAIALAVGATLMMTQDASADHCAYRSGHGYYAAPVISYRVPVYHHHYRSNYSPYHRHYHSGYRGTYGSPYRSYYGGSYYGRGYYGRGTSIGIGRGGISLNFGF